MKQRVLQGLQAGLYLSGLSWIYVRAASPIGAVILMYHSVSTPERRSWHDPSNTIDANLFRRQMTFLARHRRVVGLSDLVATIRKGEEPPAGTVVVTLDDGYLDNLEVAAPILAELGLPALLYLCTGYVGRGENQWVDRVHTIFRTRSRENLALPGRSTPIRLDHGPVERSARAEINSAMIRGNLDQRQVLLAALTEQLQPRETGPRLTMNWDEARRLRDNYDLMELGVHTSDHCDLLNADSAVRDHEITTCRDEFRRELGYEPAHFSFPYGRSDADGRKLVEAAGLSSAVASGARRQITSASDPYQLTRIAAPESMTFFRYKTGGAYPSLPERLFGRS